MTAKLLVVDDAMSMRSFVSTILEKAGYVVIQASNGVEALRLVNKEHPDLVLLDIEMPLMDGLECCQKIKTDAKFEDVRVIMVTTLSQYKKIRQAFKMGADDYIVKPVDPKELCAKVEELVKFVEMRKFLKS